jgi:prepilin-type N-terminal cleavage/methylation domain-containing protein
MHAKRSAFTLIEMLVSIVLLTMLLAIALVSYRYMVLHFKRAVNLFPEQAVRFHQFRNTVRSMEDYFVYSGSGFSSKTEGTVYYESDRTFIRFISSSPIIGYKTSLVSFKCTNHRLEYYEQPLYGSGIDYRQPEFAKNVLPLVIFDNIDNCQFSEHKTEGKPTAIQLKFTQSSRHFDLKVAVPTSFDYVGKLMKWYDNER